MKNRGINAQRLAREPEEKRFAEAWERYNVTGYTLDYLLGPVGTGKPIAPGDRDREVAATVIQWLGSHVGSCFLRELGYERVESKAIPAKRRPAKRSTYKRSDAR